MKDFLFKMPTKVQFGSGITGQLGKMLKEQGCRHAFIVTGSFLAKSLIIEKVLVALENEAIAYTVYSNLESEPSVEQVDNAAQALKESGADTVVAVGGGSRLDAAKAIALLQTHEGSIVDYLFGGTKSVERPIMPLICIPTTAGSGSEMTGASVISDEKKGVKVSVTHEYLIPRLAILDPDLQLDTPKFITATTGMDALTHAVESYVSLNAEPMSDALGLHAIRLIGVNLRKAIIDGQDVEARGNMAIASSMAAVAFANGGLGVIHGIAQSMGAIAHVPHGVANGLILPYGMRVNAKGNLRKFGDIASALGVDIAGLTAEAAADKAIDAVFKLATDVGIPMKLSEVGVTKEMFPQIIDGTMKYRLLAINPVKISDSDVESILNDAF